MVREIKHPVLIHKLNRIRELSTPRETIFELLKDIASFMVYEALSDLELVEREVDIWIGRRRFGFVEEKTVVFVPILRAGIPMLEGAQRVISNASTGFLALKRDEETLESHLYYSRLPDLSGRKVIILDPMLATGGTLAKALGEIVKGGPEQTMSIHIVCAPQGIQKVEKEFPNHKLYTISIDEGLSDRGYIIPGLGDMGDRLFS